MRSTLFALLLVLLAIKIPLVALRVHSMLPNRNPQSSAECTAGDTTEEPGRSDAAEEGMRYAAHAPQHTLNLNNTVPTFHADCRILLEPHQQHLQRVRILDLHPTQLAVGMQQVRDASAVWRTIAHTSTHNRWVSSGS